MKSGKLWRLVLAAVLVWWGLMLLGVFDFSSADEILAIGAFVAAGLVFLDK